MKNFDQLENASSPYLGKTMEAIHGNGTVNKREKLIDAVLSMKDASEKMLATILEMANMLTSKATISENIVNVLEHSFNKMSADLSNNLVKALLPPCKKDSVADEKHVVFVDMKDDTEEPFDERGWNDVVKTKLTPTLKKVPIVKTVLNKAGKGCIILPDKEAQEDVKSVLENEFKVTTSTKPRKNVLPKLKVYNIDVDKYQDKSELCSAILEKNPEISNLVDTGKSFDILFIDIKWKYAIIKVSPEIRCVINKTNRIFIDMQSLRTRDHFRPTQCYACQKHGHKQGSPECSLNNTDRSICLYCAGNHQSKACTVKKNTERHQCVNCMHSNVSDHKPNCNHTSTSLACPFVIKETNLLIRRTAGLDDDFAAKKFLI